MIRNKLIFAYLAPMVLLLLLGGLLIYVRAETLLEEELGQRLISVAEATVGGLPGSDPRRLAQLTAEDTTTIGRMRDKLDSVQQVTGVRRIFILNPRLQSLVDTREGVGFGDKLFEIQADRVELERVFEAPGVSTSSVMYSGKDGVFYKNGYAPILYEGEVVAAIGVEGSAEFFDRLVDFQYVLVFALIVGLLMIVLVSALVARTITQPIDALVVEARRLGRGDLKGEGKLERGDEFQTLASAFDEMRRDLLDRDEEMQMMLSGIAHEVRNPLGGMELFCGLLAEDLAYGSQEADYIKKVQLELEYLKRVVNDFLEFARRGQMQLVRMDAQAMINEVVGLLVWDLEGEGVTLAKGEMPDGLELTADKERLRRVLINLIRNAGQASEEGSKVTVWCREVAGPEALEELERFASHQVLLSEELEQRADGWRAIFVEDQGRGITEEQLEQVARPFFTTKEKGSGLGLALTRKIVEEHGGALAIASTARDPEGGAEQEGGTLMVVVLPFKLAIEPAKMEIPEGWLG